MLRRRHLTCIAVILALALRTSGGVARADGSRIDLTAEALRGMGIADRTLLPAIMSRDGNLLVAMRRESDPHKIAQGLPNVLDFFRLDWTHVTVSHTSMSVPIAPLQQGALLPDNRTLVLFGNYGTAVLAVDIVNLTVHEIFRHQRGQPGFRVLPPVAWVEKGHVCAPGYFYDKDQMSRGGDAVVSIDAAGSGLSAFTKIRDITQLNRQTANFVIGQWYDSRQAYFGGLRHDHKVHLDAWDGTRLVPLDAALAYGSLAVGRDRVIYAGRYSPTETRITMRDLGTGQKWTLGDGKTVYAYLYLSDAGDTALLSHFDLQGHTLTTWYAREGNAFGLRPVPGLDHVKPGTIRFSKNGDVIAFYDETGRLSFIRLPK